MARREGSDGMSHRAATKANPAARSAEDSQ